MNTVKAVVANSGAGFEHPSDPTLRIPASTPLSLAGLPSTGNDGSKIFEYDGANNLTKITWTLSSGVYVKNFSWTNGSLTGISEWVKQ